MKNVQTTQAPAYDRASLLSVAVLIVLTWGFYRTYLVFFPSFEGFQFAQHFHGGIMVLWMTLLIVQPLLISRKKIKLHKTIGKISFVIAPILMVSIFLVSRMTYHNNLKAFPTAADAIAMISLSLPGLVIFGILYALAMANRRITYNHMRYMIGTSLMMIGPGLGRILGVTFHVPPPIGVTITLGAIFLIAALFLAADLIKKRNHNPNLIVTLLMLSYWILWEAKYTAAWQGFGEFFARTFF